MKLLAQKHSTYFELSIYRNDEDTADIYKCESQLHAFEHTITTPVGQIYPPNFKLHKDKEISHIFSDKNKIPEGYAALAVEYDILASKIKIKRSEEHNAEYVRMEKMLCPFKDTNCNRNCMTYSYYQTYSLHKVTHFCALLDSLLN